MADDLADCEQQRLADIVKGLHSRLRKQLREANGDHKKIWESHCNDHEALEKYASAMCTLAVNHWTKQAPEGRVEWCYRAASEFFRGGGLKKLMEKQRRRHQFNADVNTCCCCFDAIYPAENEKLLLLDVGSCFNPFAAYEDIYPVAVDLQPAESTVYKCDFLNLEIQDLPSSRQEFCTCKSCYETTTTNQSQNFKSAKESIVKSTINEGQKVSLGKGELLQERGTETSVESEKFLSSLAFSKLADSSITDRTNILCLEEFLKDGKEIKILPSEIFHIIVFSLLLSYFPSAVQRWECCRNAHRLLRTNGILLIVTPDSSHQNKNAPMMKSWKTGIEALGFVRWKYQKQTHLHCMAFRKVAACHSGYHGNGGAEMIYIPQDFQEEEEDSGFFVCSHSEEDDTVAMECFSELPNL